MSRDLLCCILNIESSGSAVYITCCLVNCTNACLQVESWLNALLDRMVATVRHCFMEAVVTYEEKPREQWVFDPPAQVCVPS